MESPADVKELIPEFFYFPEFLQNMNGEESPICGRFHSSKAALICCEMLRIKYPFAKMEPNGAFLFRFRLGTFADNSGLTNGCSAASLGVIKRRLHQATQEGPGESLY